MRIKTVEELSIKEMIVAIRLGFKINQTELANKLKTSQPNVSRWEYGSVEPGLIDAHQIKELYKTLPDDKKYKEE